MAAVPCGQFCGQLYGSCHYSPIEIGSSSIGSTDPITDTAYLKLRNWRLTERLAADGYFVYAGARKDADLKALGAIKNVHAIRLDMTSTEDIDNSVATVTKAGRGLYGLVNNAVAKHRLSLSLAGAGNLWPCASF